MTESFRDGFAIRSAQAVDDTLIFDAYLPVWNEGTVDRAQIRACLQDPSHAATLALWGEKAVGFSDGFLTVSAENVPRWELDLLGVVPQWRGHGIAKQLVQANLVQAAVFNPQFARALIRIENIASQRAFAAAGFLEQPGAYHLFVTRLPAESRLTAPPGAALIPVQTFAYRGFWLEGDLTEDAFWAARAALTKRGEIAGVLIDTRQLSTCRTAATAGYSVAGTYRWWYYHW